MALETNSNHFVVFYRNFKKCLKRAHSTKDLRITTGIAFKITVKRDRDID